MRGRVATLADCHGEQMGDPPALLDVCDLEVWDIATAQRLSATARVVDLGLSWFPDAAKLDGYFLGHVLNSYPAQCRIKRYATPGVQQVNINATNLGKVLIPLPAGECGLDLRIRLCQELAIGVHSVHCR